MTYRILSLSLALACAGVVRSAGAQTSSPLPAATTTPPAPAPALLPPVVTVADPLWREIGDHIADSATLASMSTRDKYLRLTSDNRYLEQILKDQDKRIEQLEHRLAMLKEQREKARAAELATPRPSEEDQALAKRLDRLDHLMPATQAGTPAKPPTP
jgi:hypothetical protein